MSSIQRARESILRHLPTDLPSSIIVDSRLVEALEGDECITIQAFRSNFLRNVFFLNVNDWVFGALHLSASGIAFCASIPSDFWRPIHSETIYSITVSDKLEIVHPLARMIHMFMCTSPDLVDPPYDPSSIPPRMDLVIQTLPVPLGSPGRVRFGRSYIETIRALVE